MSLSNVICLLGGHGAGQSVARLTSVERILRGADAQGGENRGIELQSNEFDTHGYILDLKERHSHDFDVLYQKYCEEFKLEA